jgi:hypothetical protein
MARCGTLRHIKVNNPFSLTMDNYTLQIECSVVVGFGEEAMQKNFRQGQWQTAYVFFACSYMVASTGQTQSENLGAGKGSAVIEKPKRMEFQQGGCELLSDGSYWAEWTDKQGTKLSFAIGPTRGVAADVLGQSNVKYSGPRKYERILVTITTASFSFEGWHGAIIVNKGERNGSIDSIEGTTIGSWDCGSSLVRPAKARKGNKPGGHHDPASSSNDLTRSK